MNQITCIIFGGMFLIFGILFYLGKLHKHFSVWKNMSETEKNKIKIEPLCKNIGIIIMISGAIFLTKGMFENFNNNIFVIMMVCWLIVAGVDVYYIGKSKRYENNKK